MHYGHCPRSRLVVTLFCRRVFPAVLVWTHFFCDYLYALPASGILHPLQIKLSRLVPTRPVCLIIPDVLVWTRSSWSTLVPSLRNGSRHFLEITLFWEKKVILIGLCSSLSVSCQYLEPLRGRSAHDYLLPSACCCKGCSSTLLCPSTLKNGFKRKRSLEAAYVPFCPFCPS